MRIAVIGCGSIGLRHLRNLHLLGYEQVAAFDSEVAVLAQISNSVATKIFTTLDSLWEWGPEIAIIAAPSQYHISLALTAAQHNCHLFIEKPLSHSLVGINELETLVDQRGLITMVACNMRFHPGPRLVHDLIARGAIGSLLSAQIYSGSFLPNWRPTQNYLDSYSASTIWGGALLDCIHEIDLALWYCGPGSCRFAVVKSAHIIGLETDGMADLLIEHTSGVISHVHINFIQRDYRRNCLIVGEQGTIDWDFSSGVVRMYNSTGAVAEAFQQADDWVINTMYTEELRYYLDCVARNVATINPLAGGRAALEIALSAREYRER